MVKDIRPQLGRKQPTLLIVAALVAMFFASFYLYRVFEAIPAALETASPAALMITLGMMLIMFVLYTNYVITIFRLSSGSRKAWVGVIRFSITYTSMSILGTIGLSEILPIEAAFQGTYAMWILIVVVIVLITYMLTENVRKFFTPGYADEAELKEWVKYVAGVDPFRGKNLVIPEDLSA
jgi:hypothetical protein